MRLTLIAAGSRGDVQPYVALGQGLQRAGHAVRFVTTQDFAPLAAAHGLDVHPVALSVEDALGGRDTRAAIEGGSRLASGRRLLGLARRAAELLVREAWEAARGTDAVIAGFGGLLAGASVAERAGVPFVPAFNVPVTPTATIPGALVPGLSVPPRALAHRVGHWVSWQAVWQMARLSGAAARRDVLGLPPAPRWGPRATPGVPLLYGISPAVLPRPADWGAHVQLTGFWFLDAPDDYAPPPALADFLARGPAPVYVGFGSMGSTDPAALLAVVLDAVARHGGRAVVHSGWAGLRAGALPPEVLVVDAVPHAWLFARVRAAVHHGGAGTAAAAFRAGLPSVVVPFHGDQPFWARLAHTLGVAPAPIPRRRLTADRLARALDAVTADAAMRDRAAALGARVRREDGVAAAVALIGGMRR